MSTNIGILDYKGENNNPLTNKPYSDNYKKLANIWKTYPAYKNAKQIINDIQNHQVILVVSGTGSGKTVLLPKYLLHTFDYKGKIAITLPKQIVTKSSAEFASKTLDVELGTHVGYKYKGSPKNMMSKDTNLLYATDGTIVRKLLNDPKLEEFDAVIIDEAHERKVQIDLLLLLLKKTIKLRPEFKLIIMSATINADIFKNYFNEFNYKQLNLSGKTNYPIESIFLKKSIDKNNYLDKGFDILKELLNKIKLSDNTNSDILFFVTSSNEANKICKKISSLFTIKKISDINPICIEVYSGMPQNKEFLATDKNEYKKLGHKIKIVISTNVAESSLTIDGIKYVIDGGYEFLSGYDHIQKARILNMTRTTKAQIKQRMGRAGRTGPGVCYHLYTKEEYNKFKDFPEPDIRKGDISSELLSLFSINIIKNTNDLLNLLQEMIEPPSEELIKSGLYDLQKLGLIKDNLLTDKGKIFTKLLVSDIYLTNCIFYSYFYKCSYEMILIVSLINASKYNFKNIFNIPKVLDDKKQENYLKKKFKEKKEKFKHKYGDHISLLKIIDKFKEKSKKYQDKDKIKTWCYKNFLKYDTLKKTIKNNHKIKNTLFKTFSDFNINSNLDELQKLDNHKILDINYSNINDRLILSLFLGLNTKKAKFNNKNNTYSTEYSTNVKISKNSYLDNNPNNIIYTELFIQNISKELNIVSKIPTKFIK